MYNRYIPEDAFYTPVEQAVPPERPGSPGPERKPAQPFRLPEIFSGKESLSGLLKSLHLETVDPGDILLLLIMLYLLVEGDDLELVIALGLTLLMGLGDEK